MAGIIGWKPHRAAGESTWRKFIHGKRIHQDTRKDILGEIAADLTPQLTEEERTVEGQVIPLEVIKDQLHEVLVLHSNWWDGLCERLQSAIPVESTDIINMAVLRLAVVEVAIRASALFLLVDYRVDSSAQQETARIDVQKFLLPMILRQALKRAGITRQQLAEELGVTKEAVDQWLARDALVAVERLDEIAEMLSAGMGQDPDFLRRILRLARGWTQLFRGVSARVDSEEPNHMVNALTGMIQSALVSLKEQVAPLGTLERMSVLTHLLLLGSDLPPGPELRRAMLAREAGDDWKGVISTPMHEWEAFLTNALSIEKHALDMKRIRSVKGFTFLWADEERTRLSRMIGVFVSPEKLRSFLGPDFKGTPEQLLALMGRFLNYYRSEEYNHSEVERPEAWRMSMEIAESSQLHIRSARNDHERMRWEVLIWFGYAQGIALLTKEWQEIDARDDTLEMLTWLKRIPEVRRSIPPLPEKVDPVLQGTLALLRAQLSQLENLESISEFLEGKLEQEELDRALAALQNRLAQKEQAGREPDSHAQEEATRLKALSTTLGEKMKDVVARSRTKRAEMESLLRQLRGFSLS
ncbi:helix-turn-helix domain-containing protein [Cystobacter fuscus]|uniref:helix-turn-helix domain-containing protein n=1 Tax=Cystobacter fuscus TaxID=43 RepID=UPI0037C1ADAE